MRLCLVDADELARWHDRSSSGFIKSS